MRKAHIFIFMLIICPLSAGAVTLSNLYSAQLPIHSSVTWRRLQIMPKAMQQVLIKVSGNADIATVDGVPDALKKAASYVTQYSYIRKPEAEKNKLLIQIQFNSGAIHKLLRQLGQPVWGRNRPLTLLWVTVTDDSDSQLIGGDNNGPLLESLRKDAQLRGLPMVLPVMDLSDMQKINATDVIQGQWNAIQAASQRYSPDAILLVNVDKSQPKAINSTWSLSLQGKSDQWQESGQSVDQVLDQGFNALANTLASQYAAIENKEQAQQGIQIQIDGLNNVAEYAKIQKYLLSLTGVSQVELASVLANQLIFNVKLNGSLQSLKQQIKLGNKLQAVIPTDDVLGEQQGLVYQLYSSRVQPQMPAQVPVQS